MVLSGGAFVAGTLALAVLAVARCPLVFEADRGDGGPGGLRGLLLRRRGWWRPPSSPDHDARTDSYLAMYLSVIGSARGGPGVVGALARYSGAVDCVLTAAAAAVEAAGTVLCAQDAAAVAALAVAVVAFAYLLVVAPHPSPLKAVLSAVSAALCVTVAAFVLLALRGSSVEVAAAWTNRAQTAALVASGVAVLGTTASIAGLVLARGRRSAPGDTTGGHLPIAHDGPLLSVAPSQPPAG